MLRKYPDADLKVLVIWTPLLQNDSKPAAQRASIYLPDSRVEHFWDLWSYANRTYAKSFDLPVTEAWDLFVLYAPGSRWQSSFPEATSWMQHRNLEKGEPYTQDKLEAELLKYLK